jgi:hypothetical protein
MNTRALALVAACLLVHTALAVDFDVTALTQNNKFNTQVAVETSRFDVLFAGYGILAATGSLLAALNLAPPLQASAYARDAYGVPFTPEAETQKRFSPWEPSLTGE